MDLALAAASRAIDHVTDRRFWVDDSANSVRYYNPIDAGRLWIDDLVTLTEVAVDVSGNASFSETWTLNEDFYLEPLNAAADSEPWTSIRVSPLSARYFPAFYPRSVRVTGKFGWAAVPDPIKQATGIIAAKLFKRAREAPFGVIASGELPMRIAQNDVDVQLLVAPYRRANHQF